MDRRTRKRRRKVKERRTRAAAHIRPPSSSCPPVLIYPSAALIVLAHAHPLPPSSASLVHSHSLLLSLSSLVRILVLPHTPSPVSLIAPLPILRQKMEDGEGKQGERVEDEGTCPRPPTPTLAPLLFVRPLSVIRPCSSAARNMPAVFAVDRSSPHVGVVVVRWWSLSSVRRSAV
ncbi:hypothetical protein BDN70DRAFT_721824 [Pholiota conissans]|uniref:Uncharacterized protein n=1 Tax=Pholiota conissans TaxID=109636 RepID=A0A9P6CS72_9AGAR|nr:hypothetical protein BDN70DRAFT_721824 [Pholiota conissans]